MLAKHFFFPFVCNYVLNLSVPSYSRPNFSMDSHLISHFCMHLLEGAQSVSLTFSDTKRHISPPNKKGCG